MSKHTVRLTPKDLQEIQKVVEEYNVQNFILEESGHSGIGSTINMIFSEQRGNRFVEVKVEISGVENW